MNRLKPERQAQIVSLLCEGCSIRSIERITRVNRDTVCNLLARVGKHCEAIIDREVQGLHLEAVEFDELWGYVYKKQRRVQPGDPAEYGDNYTFLALCPNSKLILGFAVGKRTHETTDQFVANISRRIKGKVQVASDAWMPYRTTIPHHFGDRAPYMQVIKHYEGDADQHRYAPPKVRAVEHVWIQGMPEKRLACTSHIERFNWSCRTYTRRLTRLSNGFSRKAANLRAAVALFVVWYNWVKKHTSLGMTPAMAMGIASAAWTIDQLVPGN